MHIGWKKKRAGYFTRQAFEINRLKYSIEEIFVFAMNKKLKILFIAVLSVTVVFLVIPLPDPLFDDDYSTVVLDRNGELLRVFLNNKQMWHLPPAKDTSIPNKLKQAVLQFEDRYFYRHPGVNPVALLRALKQNISNGKIVSGASTITMQTARLIKPKARTYANKLLEILQAFKMELLYSKEEILALYLNHAPYGGNIVGYRAAALRYFRKMPASLSWAEAATLAVLPNAPGVIAPTADHPVALKRKRDKLLLRLKKEGLLTDESYRLALLEPVPGRSYSAEILAPHLTRWLHQRYAQQAVIRTTIDAGLQKMAEDAVREYSAYLQAQGILHAAVLLVDNAGGKVRAYVGSPDFFDREHSGQVDGVRAPRSSGSVLKPFLYALSMDEGLILPQTQIRDVPSYFGAFSPSNADRKYRGIVSARQALIYSLNVPAVRLLNAFGLHTFYDFLKEAGLHTLFRRPDGYGLPLIIGGAEVTLWDMAALYHGLAGGGRFTPLTVLQNERPETESYRQLISPGAAYLTLKVLNEVMRPGSEYYWRQYSDQWPLSWKTGTSYGQRDAWAVGVSPQWTVAVWAGNFNGQGNANISGAAIAGPLLFDLYRSLPKDPAKASFVKPQDDLKEIEICAKTGFKAAENCPEKLWTEAPLHMKPLRLCPYHKRIFVSNDLSEQVCSLCWNENDHHSVVRLVYPADVNQFLRQSGRLMEDLPPHRPSCPALAAASPLKILYPQKNASLWIPRDFNGRLQQVSLRAVHQQLNRRVFWYLDNRFLGSSREKHDLAVTLSKGWHELQIIDESGYSDHVRFYANLRE